VAGSRPSRYRLALFDFDGTLADSFPWFLEVANRLAGEHRFRRIEEHEIAALRSHSARHLIEHLGVPLWKLPALARQVRQQMARDIARIALFPGVELLLRGLAERGVRLAIVTSNSADNVRRVLGPELSALIQHYACGATLFGKGSKLRGVLRDSGVPAAEALSIGDEIRDLEAAREAGIAFGAVAWGYTDPDAFRALAPDMIFSRVEEILEAAGD
jgi:phosphoglycolate phosphatase